MVNFQIICYLNGCSRTENRLFFLKMKGITIQYLIGLILTGYLKVLYLLIRTFYIYVRMCKLKKEILSVI